MWTTIFKFSLVLLFSMTTSGFSENHCSYISPTGNDRNEGNLKHPFATLTRARNAVRTYRQQNRKTPITIYLREGYYPLSGTFRLGEKDSGTPEAPLIFSAYPGETAHLTGGKEISDFQPLDPGSAVGKRIPTQSKKKVLQIDLKSRGITDFGAITARGFGRAIQPAGLELYFNEKPMPLARWPNRGWAHIKAAPDSLENRGFVYSGTRPVGWDSIADIWMHGYWKWDWADSYVHVARIDTVRKIIWTDPPHGNYPYTAGKRYYIFNLPEELDQPGEWYLDRKSGVLYFWPPSDLDTSRVFVSLLREPMISLNNTGYISFRNLTLEYTCGAGVEIIGGSNNLVKNCTLRNMGTVAVSIGKLIGNIGGIIYKNTLYDGRAGIHNGVQGCEIYATGEGGIILGGGNRRTLTPGNNFADNNRIHDCSRWVRTYRAGIFMYGVGNHVTHNLIYNLPHTAVFFWGNDHLLEYNEINHVCMETGDAGAFYNGRDWTQRGSIIRYNYFHHLHGVEGKKGFTDVMAVYLDDWSSGATIFGNLFYKAGRTVMIGGGRDNLVENNIFIDGQPALHIDARGLGWAKYYFNGENTTLFDRLQAIHPQQPPYSIHYPQLVHLLEDEPVLPKGNRIIRNISYGGKWIELQNGVDDRMVYFKDNLIGQDPGFVDFKNHNFQLRDDSPGYKLGFQRIPLEKIGVYQENR